MKKGGACIGYEKVAMALFGYPGRHPHFWEALGAVSDKTMAAYGVALSAIVVNGDGVPGPSFYPIIGLSIPSRGQGLPPKHMKAWSDQITKIYSIARKVVL